VFRNRDFQVNLINADNDFKKLENKVSAHVEICAAGQEHIPQIQLVKGRTRYFWVSLPFKKVPKMMVDECFAMVTTCLNELAQLDLICFLIWLESFVKRCFSKNIYCPSILSYLPNSYMGREWDSGGVPDEVIDKHVQFSAALKEDLLFVTSNRTSIIILSPSHDADLVHCTTSSDLFVKS